MTKRATRRMKGKSLVTPEAQVYKPTIYFNNGNIPANLANVKPGSRVSITVTGKIVRRTEDTGGVAGVDFEIGGIKSPRKK